MPLFTALAIAGSGMAAEAERLTAVASNIANANSVGASPGAAYRAREVVFQAVSSGNESDEAAASFASQIIKMLAVAISGSGPQGSSGG